MMNLIYAVLGLAVVTGGLMVARRHLSTKNYDLLVVGVAVLAYLLLCMWIGMLGWRAGVWLATGR